MTPWDDDVRDDAGRAQLPALASHPRLVAATPEQFARWDAAAQQHGTSFMRWAVEALDQAAANTLRNAARRPGVDGPP